MRVSGNAIDTLDNSVLQSWVMHLGLRHQGVLLTAIRGCDISPKEDISKSLIRCYRYEILKCHCGDAAKSASFIEFVSENELDRRMIRFLKNCDHYPMHYVLHLMHATEIVGYKKPSVDWLWFYRKLCKILHVNPEGEEQLDKRLNATEEQFAQW